MNWLRALLPLWSPTPKGMARVGVLNTGELIVVDAAGNCRTYDRDTTQLIREALAPAADVGATNLFVAKRRQQ